MSKSLQDQLMGAGLIDKKKAKKLSNSAKKEKYQKTRTGQDLDSESKKRAQQALKAKQEKDRLLNLERKAADEQKALYAQVVQLVNHYREQNRQGDFEYNFSDAGKIKKIRLTKELFEKTSRGLLSIVRLGEVYELVPRPVALKVQERMPELVVVENYESYKADNAKAQAVSSEAAGGEADSDEDYYANFEIPDDLMW